MLRPSACSTVVALLALGVPLGAHAAGVPPTIHAQGVLRQSAGGLESGSFTLVFRLYDAASGGTELFSETQPNVAVESGVFSVRVGSINALPGTLFVNQPQLFLGVQVMGDAGGELSPRIALGTVPYAFQAAHADDADTLDGVDSAAFQRTLSVTAPLQLSADNTLSLGVPGCASGSVLKFNGTVWACTPDNDSGGDITGVTPGSGLSSGGANGAVSLALVDCANSEILKRVNGAWACSADDDAGGDITGVAAGGGLTGGGNSGAVSLALMTCNNNEILKRVNGAWTCSADDDAGGDITGVAAGGGLTGGGNSGAVSLALMTCDNNEILKRVNGAWTCSVDDNAGGDILAVNTGVGSGLVGGALSGTANLSLTSCNAGEILKFGLVSGWTCALDDDTGGDITAVSPGTGLSGGSMSGAATLSIKPCGNQEVLKYDTATATWNCASDTLGPSYTAGNGLLLTGQTFSIANNSVNSSMVEDNTLGTADVASIDVAKINGAASVAGNNAFTGTNTFASGSTFNSGVVLNAGAAPDGTLTEAGVSFNNAGNAVFTLANGGAGVARLQLEASAAVGATLNVPPGDAPTTPTAGDVWNETAVPGLRTSTGGVTQRLSGVICVATPSADNLVAAAAAADFATNCVIPAAALTAGRVLRITAGGLMTNNAVGDTHQLAIQMNDTSVFANSSSNVGSTGGNRLYLASVTLIVAAHSATNVTFEGNGTVTLPIPTLGTSARVTPDSVTGSTVVTNVAGNYVLEVESRWGGADANDVLTLREFVVELL